MDNKRVEGSLDAIKLHGKNAQELGFEIRWEVEEVRKYIEKLEERVIEAGLNLEDIEAEINKEPS